MSDSLQQTIVGVLAEIAPEADLATLSGTVALRDQLDLDSMDFLRFVQALDRKLGIAVPEADYPKLATLEGCVAYLGQRAARV